VRNDIAWKQLFGELDRNGPALHLQIRMTLVNAIEAGLLTREARLPSSRRLSDLLGIARNTVTTAYEQLIDEGLLVSRERSGIFVAEQGPRSGTEHNIIAPSAYDWSSRFAIRPSLMPQITKPRDWLAYRYPFLFGQFDPALFPANNWRESVRVASSVREINGWAGDMIDEDDPDLVEQLRQHVLPRRGILASSDEIIITIGSQQALSLLVQLLVRADTPVGIEDPCYPDIRNMLGMATKDLRSLTVDTKGLVPDHRLADRKVVFTTIGHQCPTTAVMPLERRRALLDAAQTHDLLLIEDDYEADLAYGEETEIPCLKSLDTEGRVIYIGSFSKVLAPGLRVGYIVAPRAVITELRCLRRLMLRHPPSNNQRSLAAFIALGHYRSHLRQTGAVLFERAAIMGEGLSEFLPSCRWRRDPGATSFWIEGPEGLDARALSLDARHNGILIEPGDIFFADPDRGRHCFRMGFASIRTDRITEGLAGLGRLLAAAHGDQREAANSANPCMLLSSARAPSTRIDTRR